jgi:hypothetical protein
VREPDQDLTLDGHLITHLSCETVLTGHLVNQIMAFQQSHVLKLEFLKMASLMTQHVVIQTDFCASEDLPDKILIITIFQSINN